MRFIGSDTEGQLTREVRAVASGALPSGDPVVVNSDGTVSVVAESTFSQQAGTPVVYEAATTGYTSSTYDSTSKKIVFVYTDYGNSNYGTAVVATISGMSISFGTPVVFASTSVTFNSVSYNESANKIVVAYRDVSNSFYGTCVVGSVIGDSISFGAPVVFESANSVYISVVYDVSQQKTVICYTDLTNSYRGTAIVGTVSGTSISFGSPALFSALQTLGVSAVYDSANQKVVVAYQDGQNSNNGKATVGTVSGTSISFGTAATFSTSNTFYITAAYDSGAQKVVVAYQDFNNLESGTAVVGSVSGTSISFGTPVVFKADEVPTISLTYDSAAQKISIFYEDRNGLRYGIAVSGTVSGNSISFGSETVFEAGNTNFISSAYDSQNEKIAIVYRDADNSFYGTACVFQNAYTSINLTSENFLGFTSSAYADTQTATIQSQGAINDKQSGLTPGQAYYVQTDGTLSTTPDDISVFAGTAVAANKIIVGG